MDCFRIRTGELLYWCIDCTDCYNCAFSQDCDNCTDSVFLKNCTGCKHCLMCSNLRNKEYYVENKKVSQEEFEQFRTMLGSWNRLQSAMERFEKLQLEYPQKYIHGVHNEDVVGDYLTNCKHAEYCFDSPDLWDCKYVFQAFGGLKNCMDIQECGEAERLYECAFSGYRSQNGMCIAHSIGGQADMYYCMRSPHSEHLFGCIGCRKKKYCIFNKQYSKEEYEKLVARIIEHMQKTKEWGEFFSLELAEYPYNETLAQDYYPLTKEEALRRGLRWKDEVEKRDQYLGPEVKIPDDINGVEESICDKILTSKEGGKMFKIIPQELAIHKKMNLPLPRESFLERHKKRFQKRNPRPLHDRTCDKCNTPFKTTFAPDRPEKIYCERCYLESIS